MALDVGHVFVQVQDGPENMLIGIMLAAWQSAQQPAETAAILQMRLCVPGYGSVTRLPGRILQCHAGNTCFLQLPSCLGLTEVAGDPIW